MSRRGWYVERWGPLGWTETAVKLAAHAVAFAALAAAAGGDLGWQGGVRGAELVLLGLATLGLVGAVGERLLFREVVSMAFVVVNVLAHAAMTAAVAVAPGPRWTLVAFCALMAAGEGVKITFFATTGYSVRRVPQRVVIGLTGLFAAGYLTVLLLELAR